MFSSLKIDLYRFIRFKPVWFLTVVFVVYLLFICLISLPVGGINGYKTESVRLADGTERLMYKYSTVVAGDLGSIGDDPGEIYEETIYYCSERIPASGALLTTLSVLLFEFVTGKKGTIGNRIATGTSRFKFSAGKFLFVFITDIGFVVIGTIMLFIAMLVSGCSPIAGSYVLREIILSVVIYALLIPSVIVLMLGINYNLGPIVSILLAVTVLSVSVLTGDYAYTYLYDYMTYEVGTAEDTDADFDKRYLYVAATEACITTALDSDRCEYISSIREDDSEVNLFSLFQTPEKQIISASFWIIVSNSVSVFLYKKMERI